MPGAMVDIGTGATITFTSTGWVAELVNIAWNGISRPAIDTTHLGLQPPPAGKFGARRYLPGDISDPGTLEVEFHLNPNVNPPVEGAPETIVITFPLVVGDLTPATWSATGFMTDMSFNVPLEDKMMGRFTIKLTGNVTMTDSTA